MPESRPMSTSRRVSVDDRLLPDKFYREHLLHFPTLAVDMVVTDKSSRFLLVKRNRNNLTWVGAWGTPGGRVFRNERLRDAAHRVLLRETGLSVAPKDFAFKGVQEIITTKEHGVTMVFAAISNNTSVRRDGTSSSVCWFSGGEVPRSLREEFRAILALGGVRLRWEKIPTRT